MGKIYKGKVVKIMEFGAFVNFLGKQDGLVHISELADKRVAKVGDVVKEGDEVSVKVVGFDRGKVKLSYEASFLLKIYFLDQAYRLYYNQHLHSVFHQ
jgi:polyribonucleotide nucleotidyltransferase